MSYWKRILQDVMADANNELSIGPGSGSNLAANGIFAGTATSTLGVAGIQVNIRSDQNLTVYTDQSHGIIPGVGTVTTNGTTTLSGSGTKFLRDFHVGDQIWVDGETVRVVNAIASDVSLTVTTAFGTIAGGLSFTQYAWDITDEFNFYANLGGKSWTIQATASFFRIRLKNVGAATTTFIRLQSAMCPVVEAVPRALSAEGNLKTGVYEIEDQNTGSIVGINQMGELRVAEHVRLVGSYFSGDTVDGNFWTTTPTAGGTSSQTLGTLTLNTGAGPAGGVFVQSVRVGRYVSGAPNYFRAVVRVPALAGAGACVRRWGAFDANDGFFFSTDGTTLSLTCRKATSDTNTVSSGSFNGNNGISYLLDTNAHLYEIHYENRSAYFYIDGLFIHKFSAPMSTFVSTMHLKIGFEAQNAALVTDLNTLEVRVASINRMGPALSRPAWRYQAGALSATVLKYSPGTLHRISINKATGTSVTLYDSTNTGAPTNTICVVDPTKAVGALEYGLDFYNGLILVTVGAVDITMLDVSASVRFVYTGSTLGWVRAFPYGSSVSAPTTWRGYIDGLVLSNNGSDANNDVDVAIGQCRDSTNVIDMNLSSVLTKRLDANWVVGTNQGGLDTGSKANSTWYHVWLIERIDTGVVDALFSTSATSPTLPSNYGHKRRIGAVRTDGSGNILAFSQVGDQFLWMTPINDAEGATITDTATLFTLSIPLGVKTVPIFSTQDFKNGANAIYYWSSPDVTDNAVSTTVFNSYAPNGTAFDPTWMKGGCSARSNTSSQMRGRSDTASGVTYIRTHGWIDPRGKDA